MSRPLIPEQFRYRSMLDEEGTVAAKKGGWCHLCGVTFPVGERITFLRGAYKRFGDPSDRVHPDCLKELPDTPQDSEWSRSGIKVGYTRVNKPRHGKKYVVMFEGEDPWYTGAEREAQGAVKFCVQCLGCTFDPSMGFELEGLSVE